SVLGANLDADASELAFDAGLEGVDFLGRDVIRIRIELAENAVDRGFHKLAAADVFDVVAFDLVERVGKDLEQFVVVFRELLGLRLIGPRPLANRRDRTENPQHNQQRATFHRRSPMNAKGKWALGRARGVHFWGEQATPQLRLDSLAYLTQIVV